MRQALFIAAGLSAVVCVGCATSTATPPTPPAAFAAGGDAAADLAAAPQPGWLEGFAAPALSDAVSAALAGNPGLAAADARAQASRARARGAIGGLLPSLDLSFGANRTESPDGFGARDAVDRLSAGATASWEADVWGRVRATVGAADRNADAAEADAAAARLSVTGQAAQAWVDLVAAQELLNLAQEDLATRTRALTLTERRYERGLLTALAVRTARSQAASARAAEAQAADGLLIAARRLQLITGAYPDGAVRAGGDVPALPPLAAAGAPEALLALRPDVQAAEARLQAAGFRLREARASLLPRLTLSARADGGGGQLADALDPDDLVTQLIAGLVAPVFQGGALRAEARASEADLRAAAADYVTTALDAWREVEAAISADASLEIRERELAAAALEAKEALDLAEREYERGVASIFDLLDAFSRRIDAERGLISARAERVTNRIAYHVALGQPGFASAAPEEAAP